MLATRLLGLTLFGLAAACGGGAADTGGGSAGTGQAGGQWVQVFDFCCATLGEVDRSSATEYTGVYQQAGDGVERIVTAFVVDASVEPAQLTEQELFRDDLAPLFGSFVELAHDGDTRAYAIVGGHALRIFALDGAGGTWSEVTLLDVPGGRFKELVAGTDPNGDVVLVAHVESTQFGRRRYLVRGRDLNWTFAQLSANSELRIRSHQLLFDAQGRAHYIADVDNTQSLWLRIDGETEAQGPEDQEALARTLGGEVVGSREVTDAVVQSTFDGAESTIYEEDKVVAVYGHGFEPDGYEHLLFPNDGHAHRSSNGAWSHASRPDNFPESVAFDEFGPLLVVRDGVYVFER